MKKGLIAVILGLLLVSLIPMAVSASCPECSWMCDIPNLYMVSYSQGGHFVSVQVEALTSKAAAESLGLRAGYNCFVRRILPVVKKDLQWYRVWYWNQDLFRLVVTDIQALSTDDAALQLGLKDCYFVRLR
jgi:hypothetical protein